MEKNDKYKIRSVKYNFIMNVILKISLFIFPLITFPYVSRILGADGNGKISFATSVISYCTMFAMLGIPTYGIRACAQCRDNKDQLSKTVQELLIICISGTVLTYGVLIALIFFIPRFSEDKSLILIMSLSLVLSSIGIEWFYQGIEQYAYITKRNIAFKFIAVIMMFLFVKTKTDYVIYGGITVLGTVGSNVLNLLRARNYISFRPVGQYNIKKHLAPTFDFFLLTVASTIYSNLDTVMIGLMTNDFEVGYYNAGVKVRSILLGFINALSTVLLPRASYYIKNKMYNDYNKIINSSINIILYMSLPLTVFFMMESKDAVLFLAGSQYENAILPMVIIMPTLLFAGLNNLTGIQVLGSLGLEKYTVISTSAAAILDLVLNAIIIPIYGASGAAFSTMLAELLAMIIQIRFIQTKTSNNIKIRFDSKNVIKIALSVGLSALAVFLFGDVLLINNHFFVLLITSAIFFGLYFIFLFALHEKVTKEFIVPFIKKLINKFLYK